MRARCQPARRPHRAVSARIVIAVVTTLVAWSLTADRARAQDVQSRQLGFGLQRGVYFGYVLNADGKVSIFESGPSGVNGWGYDDMIGQLPMTFTNPKTIQPDVRNLASAVWVVHEDQLGADGALPLDHLKDAIGQEGAQHLGDRRGDA